MINKFHLCRTFSGHGDVRIIYCKSCSLKRYISLLHTPPPMRCEDKTKIHLTVLHEILVLAV